MLMSDFLDYVRTALLDDNVEPYLWSDQTLMLLAKEAEIEACQRANLILSDEFTFTTQANQATYTVPDNVIQIIKMTADDTPVIRKSFVELMGLPERIEKPIYYGYLSDTMIAMYPTPDKEYTVKTVCSVYPSSDLYSFSIPEIYQRDLAYYVAGMALLNEDIDTKDSNKASEFLAIFNQKFGEPVSYKSVRRRKLQGNERMALSNKDRFGFV